jgi:hypothetical protein
LLLDDEAQAALPDIVRREWSRRLATSAAGTAAATNVPRLADGTLMLLDENLKWSGGSCRSDKTNLVLGEV